MDRGAEYTIARHLRIQKKLKQKKNYYILFHPQLGTGNPSKSNIIKSIDVWQQVEAANALITWKTFWNKTHLLNYPKNKVKLLVQRVQRYTVWIFGCKSCSINIVEKLLSVCLPNGSLSIHGGICFSFLFAWKNRISRFQFASANRFYWKWNVWEEFMRNFKDSTPCKRENHSWNLNERTWCPLSGVLK